MFSGRPFRIWLLKLILFILVKSPYIFYIRCCLSQSTYPHPTHHQKEHDRCKQQHATTTKQALHSLSHTIMGLCASTPSQPPTQDPATTTTTDPTSIPTLTSTTTTSLTTNASSSTTDQVKVTSSFMRRIAANMRSGNQRSTQKDFKPSIQFLTIISSPTTPFNVYSRIILTEVLRTISGEYCILHMVDDVREQILSCYFPKINGTAIASGIGKDSSMASSSSGRKQQMDRPIFWTTDLKDDNNEEEERSLVAKTCLEGHAYNLEDVTRHKSFNPKKDLPLGLQLSQLKSFCIQPIRYMGDQTRIIGK